MSEGNSAHRSPFSLVEIVEPVEVEQPPENKQLFSDAEFQLDGATEEYANSPDKLHNSKDPNLGIKHEQPVHRLMCWLKARGVSNTEIAKRVKMSDAWVSQVCRQPWFRLRLIQEMKEAGLDAVREMIKGAALDSVETLIQLRDTPTTPAAVRKAASDSLLDRYLGKAVQPIEVDKPDQPRTPDVRALDAQIAELETELGLQQSPT